MHKDAISNDPVCRGHCVAHISLRAHVRAMHQNKTTFFALMATVRISPFAKKDDSLVVVQKKDTHSYRFSAKWIVETIKFKVELEEMSQIEFVWPGGNRSSEKE